jgi:hypothetical protein
MQYLSTYYGVSFCIGHSYRLDEVLHCLGGPRQGFPCAMVVDMLIHTPGPTGVEVGREGWQVGCDDHPIP